MKHVKILVFICLTMAPLAGETAIITEEQLQNKIAEEVKPKPWRYVYSHTINSNFTHGTAAGIAKFSLAAIGAIAGNEIAQRTTNLAKITKEGSYPVGFFGFLIGGISTWKLFNKIALKRYDYKFTNRMILFLENWNSGLNHKQHCPSEVIPFFDELEKKYQTEKENKHEKLYITNNIYGIYRNISQMCSSKSSLTPQPQK
jgi:hypothetical protein